MAIHIKNPSFGASIDEFVYKSIKYNHGVGEVRIYEDDEAAREILRTYGFLQDVTQEEQEKVEAEKKRTAESANQPSEATPDQPRSDKEEQPSTPPKRRGVRRKRITRRRRRS